MATNKEKNKEEGIVSAKSLCPVCNKHIFIKWYEYCPVCNWYHNILQELRADAKNMDNILSLSEAKEAYKKGEEIY